MSAPLKQSADVIIRRQGGRRLAFHQTADRICIMNPTSEFVWEQCTGQYTNHQTQNEEEKTS